MQKYPYLARYISPSPYQGVVLWMTEPRSGYVVYAPAAMLNPPAPGGEEGVTEVKLFEAMTPSSWELETYNGSVIMRNSADPTLGP